MKRISTFTIATAFALILALGFAGTAQAALDAQSVTLNDGTAWTKIALFADGASVTVAPGADIIVGFTLSGTDSPPGTDWKCTEWEILLGSSSGEEDHGNHASTFSNAFEEFTIIAPALEETYDLQLTSRGNDNGGNCSGTSQTITLVDAVIVAESADLEIVKQNVMGPYDLDGDLNGTNTTFGAVIPNLTGPDAGGIWIGLAEPQRFKFEIKITNNGDMASAMGAVITDVVPAEYNLDPILQEDDENGPIDGACDDGDADFLCDGTSGGTPLIGAVSDDETKCTVSVDQPDGADKDVEPPLDQRFKEPELLTITIGTMDNGEMCTVTVYVITDGNPGHVMKVADVERCTNAPLNSTAQLSAGVDCVVNDPDQVLLFTLYEPTSCAQVGVKKDITDPIYDTISLNDGFKLFDPQSGERILGPQGSLQLTCNFLP